MPEAIGLPPLTRPVSLRSLADLAALREVVGLRSRLVGLTPRRGERGGYAKGISRRCGEWFSPPRKGAAPTDDPTEGALSGECRMIGWEIGKI